MRRGSVPGSHPVPKIEDLIATIRPDILIMQTGTNLFDLFPDRKTVIIILTDSDAFDARTVADTISDRLLK